MKINEFIILVEQEWRKSRNLSPAHPPIEIINLPSHLYIDLRSMLGVTGWGGFLFMGSKIQEDPILNKNEVEFLYDTKTNDYQDIDFTFFENLPFGTARVAICSPPVLGSAKLSGPSYGTITGSIIANGTNGIVNYNSGVLSSYIYDGHTLTQVSKDTPVPGCSHSWKKYHGFSEIYDFCEKCDKKRA